MITVLIIGFILTISTLIIGIFAIHRLINRYYERFQGRIVNFISARGDQPSELAVISDEIAKLIAHRMIERIRSAFMVESGHIARQENALKEDIIQDTATINNPLAGLILDQLPSVKKRLARNPSALPALLGLLSRLSLVGPGSGLGRGPDSGPTFQNPRQQDFGTELAKYK